MRTCLAFCGIFACSIAAQSGIEGTVIDPATRAGVPGAKVRFFSPDSGAHETVADQTGRFALPNLAAGSYYVSVEKEGYFRLEEAEGADGRLPVTKIGGTGVERVTLELVRYGSLGGRVRDADGHPLKGVPIQLTPPQPAHDPVASGDDGSFVFSSLRPGSYLVLARVSIDPRGAGNGRVVNVPTYYPGVVDAAAAASIAIGTGANVSGIDIAVQSLPMYRIGGGVLDESGEPATGVPVRLRQLGGHPSRGSDSTVGRFGTHGGTISFYMSNPAMAADETIETVTTSENGRFSLLAPEGEWLIHVETPLERVPGTRDDRQQTGDRQIGIHQADVDNVEIRLSPTFKFTVKPEAADDNDPRSFLPPLILRSALPGRPSVFGEPENTGSAKPGAIKFDHVRAGSYTVTAAGLAALDGLYLAGFYVGGQEALKQPFYLSPAVTEGRAVFKKASGSLQGTIDGGKPATVLILPSAGSSSDVIASIDSTGEKPFAISGLAPGDYEVVAFERIDVARFSDTSFVASLAALGRHVRIDDGPVIVNLRVNGWPAP